MIPPTFDPTWSGEMQALYRHDLQEMWDRRIAPQIWNQYHDQLGRYLAIAGEHPLRILDVGCAQGTLALLLAERGHRVTAVDIRPAFLDYARSRYSHGEIEFLAANALEDPMPGGFDLVFANQIVEHLVYPGELLTRLAASLRPGGRLVMTTPNGRYVRNPLPSYRELGDPKQWESKQYSADDDGHFYAYLAEELEHEFRAAGYDEVRHEYFESPFINGHMKLRHLHGGTPTALLRGCDRALLAVPGLRARFAHQLLVTGIRPGEQDARAA